MSRRQDNGPVYSDPFRRSRNKYGTRSVVFDEMVTAFMRKAMADGISLNEVREYVFDRLNHRHGEKFFRANMEELNNLLHAIQHKLENKDEPSQEVEVNPDPTPSEPASPTRRRRGVPSTEMVSVNPTPLTEEEDDEEERENEERTLSEQHRATIKTFYKKLMIEFSEILQEPNFEIRKARRILSLGDRIYLLVHGSSVTNDDGEQEDISLRVNGLACDKKQDKDGTLIFRPFDTYEARRVGHYFHWIRTFQLGEEPLLIRLFYTLTDRFGKRTTLDEVRFSITKDKLIEMSAVDYTSLCSKKHYPDFSNGFAKRDSFRQERLSHNDR